MHCVRVVTELSNHDIIISHTIWVWVIVVALWGLASYDDGDEPYTTSEWQKYVAVLPVNVTHGDVSISDFEIDSNLKQFDKWFKEVDGHYDIRFYSHKLKYFENQNALWRLASLWLWWAHSHHLKTWLAHGTLLGWYWQQRPLPWDNDIDVQITTSSFAELEQFHGTVVTVNHYDYLVDINPGWRLDVSVNNTIDGRFIDISTGIYVDITVLRPAEPKLDYGENYEFDLVVDGHLLEKLHTMRNASEWRYQRHLLAGHLVGCKDDHYYAVSELQLEATTFVGTSALVPIAFRAILEREYPRGLRDTVYGSHSFHRDLGWVPHWHCPRNQVCRNRKLMAVANVTASSNKY